MSKKKKQPKKYLFEEVLSFLKHNSDKNFNYKQIGAAMEHNSDGERLELIEVLEGLKQQGFIKETEVGKFQCKDNKQFVNGIIDFTASGTAFVIVSEKDSDIFIREKLFRPFTTTKSGGMGIGAFECREYVRELHGDIQVVSEVEQGSTFTVSLPLRPSITQDLEAPKQGAAHG